MMYTVAMLKKENDVQMVTVVKDSIFYQDKLDEIKELQESGYVLDSTIITTSRNRFYSAKLKGICAEYVEYLKSSLDLLVKTRERWGADHEVFLQTMDLVDAHKRTLRTQIARCAKRCLDLDLPINDLAQDCVFERECRILGRD